MGVIVELARAKRRIIELERLLTEKPPTPKPVERRVINGSGVYNIVRKKFPTGEIYLSDSWGNNAYSLCDMEDIEAFLDKDETNHIKYVPERFDCDNFARLLWGQFGAPDWANYAIGLLWSDVHAIIMCIDANEDLWLIEPQTDVRRSDLLDWQGTTMRFVII